MIKQLPNYKFVGWDSLSSYKDMERGHVQKTFNKKYVSYESKLDKYKYTQAIRIKGNSDRQGAKIAYDMYRDVYRFVNKLDYHLKTPMRKGKEQPIEVSYIFRSREDASFFDRLMTPIGVNRGWNFFMAFDEVIINDKTKEARYKYLTVLCDAEIRRYSVDKYEKDGELDMDLIKVKTRTDPEITVNHDNVVYYDLSKHNELLKGFAHVRKFGDYLRAVYMGYESPVHIERLNTNIDFNDYLIKLGRIANNDDAFFSMLNQEDDWQYLFFSPIYVLSEELQTLLGSEWDNEKETDEKLREGEGLEELNKIMRWTSTKLIPVEKPDERGVYLDNVSLEDYNV